MSEWAVSLILGETESPNDRLAKALTALMRDHACDTAVITWLDASGEAWEDILEQTDEDEEAEIPVKEFIERLRADGEIMDLEANLLKDEEQILQVAIVDGTSVDIIGAGAKPNADTFGPHQDITSEYF